MRRSQLHGGERGSALAALVLVVVVAAGMAWGIRSLDLGGLFRSRADAVAAEAARAGAVDGPQGAWVVATSRGGTVVSFDLDGPDVVVAVDVLGTVGHGRARSRAADLAALVAAGRQGLAPAVLAALSRADVLLGRPVPVVSGFRSTAKQAELYAERASNPYPVAPPGSSKHEHGLAVDVPRALAPSLAGISSSTGLCQPYPGTDPVHFELCGSGS